MYHTVQSWALALNSRFAFHSVLNFFPWMDIALISHFTGVPDSGNSHFTGSSHFTGVPDFGKSHFTGVPDSGKSHFTGVPTAGEMF